MKTVSGFVVGAAVAGLAAVLSACNAGPADPTKGARVVRVVAAENAWGDVAAQIGGRHASVSSIIGGSNADPHLYSADPRAAARLARANLAIVNGLGYDDFARRLLAAAPAARRRVLTIADVIRPKGPEANPHLWYDVPRLAAVADAIAGALAAEDPRDAAYFRSRAARFRASLRPLAAAVGAIRARHRGAPVAYTERVPGYLLDAAGLTVASPSGYARAVESGTEPSPGDVRRMDDLLSGRRVRALLYNAQAVTTATRALRDVARGAGVPVIPVTETLPRGEPSLQAWQLAQARELLRAVGG